jgi:hypothetical protein
MLENNRIVAFLTAEGFVSVVFYLLYCVLCTVYTSSGPSLASFFSFLTPAAASGPAN